MTLALRDLTVISNNLDPDELSRKFSSLLTSHKVSNDDKARLNFALGKAYDDAKQYDRAFDHYMNGNQLKKGSFNREAFRIKIDRMIDFFSPSFFNGQGKTDSKSTENRPIFIIGMPRSGTSLTEQILASHKSVTGGGEQRYWNDLTFTICTKIGDNTSYPNCITNLKANNLAALQGAFTQHLNTIDSEIAHITDKMPGNFLHLGLISLFLPKAKIVHCSRDPMDNCLSAFFQNFSTVHAYTFDLEDLGFYYNQYQRLMDHWQQVLPNTIINLSYRKNG